jgi:hypothetical protein
LFGLRLPFQKSSARGVIITGTNCINRPSLDRAHPCFERSHCALVVGQFRLEGCYINA